MCGSAWQERWSSKVVTAAEAIGRIRPGARLFVGSGAAVPLSLVEELGREHPNLADHEVYSILTLGPAPYASPERVGVLRHNALFIGANVRAAVERGDADYTPVFLSEIPGLFYTRKIPLDVALIQVTPPDESGRCSLGVSVDVVKAAAESAEMVIAEVNPQMPWLGGDSLIPVDRIDWLVPAEHPIPELPHKDPGPEAEQIARHIAGLIEDGSTLQLGIGAIPDAVLRYLDDKRDLGIHTEMLSDGVADLMRRGVITNRCKTLHPGKAVASFVLGTRRVYEFVRNNPDIELYPSDYVNDPFVISRHENMVAINTCLEVDLTGQVCSDSIGQRFYSGIGGQVDFIRGAARSRGGKPIIAMTSTARGGIVSRIVPRLHEGAGVVTTRGDVHYVVTEWGVAYLHGKPVRERAMALIQVAHPKFRSWLMAEAKQSHLIYLDQIEPPIRIPTYPKHLEKVVRDRKGERLLIRPIRPTDESLLRDLFYASSEETLYQRFFAFRRTMPHSKLQQFCNVDYEREMSIVATVPQNGGEHIVGAAVYSLDPQTQVADIAFVVEDAYQNRGIGSLLLDEIIRIAHSKGIRRFVSHVLSTNARMLHLIRKVATRCESRLEEGVWTLEFEAEPRAASWQAESGEGEPAGSASAGTGG